MIQDPERDQALEKGFLTLKEWYEEHQEPSPSDEVFSNGGDGQSQDAGSRADEDMEASEEEFEVDLNGN